MKKRHAFIMINADTDPIIIGCEISKEATEDRIKSITNKTVSKKPMYKVVNKFEYEPATVSEDFLEELKHSSYPVKMLWASYKDSAGNKIEKWIEADLVKDKITDFVEFVPMPWQKNY